MMLIIELKTNYVNIAHIIFWILNLKDLLISIEYVGQTFVSKMDTPHKKLAILLTYEL